ncbi:pyridoxamine 5'-phosphate oxidase family protein [Micromonospora sp. NPDC050397]|uniref:pyridoxamine 5'-phosphate oxidase family protein n=1 Tax=Micromonospora sp. NPDC050397 TaxID=3364279 RepID=UPI00384F26BA
MTDDRELLREYVRAGQLMQLATVRADGSPSVGNVWYDPHFAPDVLRFVARHDGWHSADGHRVGGHGPDGPGDGRVGGSIVAVPPDVRAGTVRGVTFTGTVRALPPVGAEEAARAFLERWPSAEMAIDPGRLARHETPSRLYEVVVAQWVLFDERRFPHESRHVLAAARTG